MKLGILGAGQLGRMLALSAHPLGIDTRVVDPKAGSPASPVAQQVVAPYASAEALDALAECDTVTFEFENVPDDAVRSLAARVRVFPSPEALRVAQDRLLEKRAFVELGIPTPRFFAVDSLAELEAAFQDLGGQLVLKTRRLGYDGKGQAVVRTAEELPAAFALMGGAPAIAEEFMAFERELSVIACRGRDGSVAHYPLTQNSHRQGILTLSVAPAPQQTAELETAAQRHMQALLERFDYVGVLALELFQVDGQLVANEIAPRVHNSGHWTIEGARTSQFENHVRAVMGLPLGSTEALCPSAMLNLIGSVPPPAALLAVPDAHLHDYGKSSRPGRKVGHVTVRADDLPTLERRIEALQAVIEAHQAG